MLAFGQTPSRCAHTSVRPGVMVGAAMKTTYGANSAVLRILSACGLEDIEQGQ